MSIIYAIEQLTPGDVPAAQYLVNAMLAVGAEKHPVLTELRRDVWRGARVWVCADNRTGLPLAMTCGKLGKRKKNLWEPYLNWYGAYTLPAYRRRGYATALYRRMEAEALSAGCRRVKSLAGSAAGAALHLSLGHQFWGKTLNDELWVDSPLPGWEALYAEEGNPPQVPGVRLSPRAVRFSMKEGLRYDPQA